MGVEPSCDLLHVPLTKQFGQKKIFALRAKIIQLSGQVRRWGSSRLRCWSNSHKEVQVYFSTRVHVARTMYNPTHPATYKVLAHEEQQ